MLREDAAEWNGWIIMEIFIEGRGYGMNTVHGIWQCTSHNFRRSLHSFRCDRSLLVLHKGSSSSFELVNGRWQSIEQMTKFTERTFGVDQSCRSSTSRSFSGSKKVLFGDRLLLHVLDRQTDVETNEIGLRSELPSHRLRRFVDAWIPEQRPTLRFLSNWHWCVWSSPDNPIGTDRDASHVERIHSDLLNEQNYLFGRLSRRKTHDDLSMQSSRLLRHLRLISAMRLSFRSRCSLLLRLTIVDSDDRLVDRLWRVDRIV